MFDELANQMRAVSRGGWRARGVLAAFVAYGRYTL
jgi:hypothetical protein